jgi:hypothetical protein
MLFPHRTRAPVCADDLDNFSTWEGGGKHWTTRTITRGLIMMTDVKTCVQGVNNFSNHS